MSTEPGVLRVDDTGPGLRPDELPRAFERFFLYDRYLRSDRRVGTGLGLAIVKALAEGMNGSVEVRSEAGLGACFVVRLPRFTPALPAANAGLTEAGKHGSVSYAGGESA